MDKEIEYSSVVLKVSVSTGYGLWTGLSILLSNVLRV